MFWGLILKSNKKYTQTLEKSFHLSAASLDHASSDNEPVQVMYTQDDNSYLLCTLHKGKVYQCALDLNFKEGDKLSFSTKGNGIVHLTGYLIPDDMDFDDDDFGDMDGEEDEELDGLVSKLKAKQKGQEDKSGKKKTVPVEESSEDEDDSDAGLDQTAEGDSDEEDDSEEQDSEDGEEEEDEEDSDDEPPAPPAKQAKLDPKALKNGKKAANGLENGDKKPQQKEKGDGKITKLQGGLMIQDLKVGSGAEAKPGRKIQVYYEGRLKTNNKVFDATKNGPGFKMTLGRGEVIKGWDIGLNGMKVGGKRRLICPPGLAYGAKGNPPVIPQNSTLVFDVELKNVM